MVSRGSSGFDGPSPSETATVNGTSRLIDTLRAMWRPRTTTWMIGAVAVCLIGVSIVIHAHPLTRVVRTPPPPAVIIRGRVVAEADRQPIRHARIHLRSDASVAPVLSDEDGHFILTVTSGGRHIVAAMKA